MAASHHVFLPSLRFRACGDARAQEEEGWRLGGDGEYSRELEPAARGTDAEDPLGSGAGTCADADSRERRALLDAFLLFVAAFSLSWECAIDPARGALTAEREGWRLWGAAAAECTALPSEAAAGLPGSLDAVCAFGPGCATLLSEWKARVPPRTGSPCDGA